LMLCRKTALVSKSPFPIPAYCEPWPVNRNITRAGPMLWPSAEYRHRVARPAQSAPSGPVAEIGPLPQGGTPIVHDPRWPNSTDRRVSRGVHSSRSA
jgi:hypothetical protein